MRWCIAVCVVLGYLMWCSHSRGQSSTVSQRSESAGVSSTPAVWPTGVIMAVQTALADLGYESAATAGILDATTQKALRQFQSTHQLPAHGNLTKNTLVALFDERCKHGCKMTVLVSATPENQATGPRDTHPACWYWLVARLCARHADHVDAAGL